MMFNNILAITAGLAASASAFDCSGHYFSFFNRAGIMSYQRLDPALNPGSQSPHLHSFDGGNALAPSMEGDATDGSSCTTARIKPDKSLYWRPTLFFNNGTGFYRVPEKSSKTYYKSGDGGQWGNVTEFPQDFSMIVGDPMKRADGDNPGGIRWGCHQPNGGGDSIFANGFPTGFTSCGYGFAAEVAFPSCWNGNKINPSSPTDHMAFPTGSGVGIEKCPTTHRAARFPTIFMEFWYDISQFDGQYSADKSPWVLANGDPTGYSFHADFLNGWEKGVLGKAIAEEGGCNCGCACGNDEMKQCFGASNVNDDSDASFKSCAARNSYGNLAAPKFDALPGCNPIQPGPQRATMASGAGCSATPSAGSGSNSTVVATSTPAESKVAATSLPYGDVSSVVSSAEAKTTDAATASAASTTKASSAATTQPAASSPKTSATASQSAMAYPQKGVADAAGAGFKPSGSCTPRYETVTAVETVTVTVK